MSEVTEKIIAVEGADADNQDFRASNCVVNACRFVELNSVTAKVCIFVNVTLPSDPTL
jgi:hypothetical protein